MLAVARPRPPLAANSMMRTHWHCQFVHCRRLFVVVMAFINFVFRKVEMNKRLPGTVFAAGEPAPCDGVGISVCVTGVGPGFFLAMLTIKI